MAFIKVHSRTILFHIFSSVLHNLQNVKGIGAFLTYSGRPFRKVGGTTENAYMYGQLLILPICEKASCSDK